MSRQDQPDGEIVKLGSELLFFLEKKLPIQSAS